MTLLQEDPQLLRAFQEGQRVALERVYRHYVRQVEAFIRSQARRLATPELMQPSAVADLIQEVFIRAFARSARRSYDPSRDFKPYLLTITRNCMVDALRRSRKEVLFADECWLEPCEPEPDEASYEPRVLAVLQGYLEQLPQHLALVYRERFVLGHSQVVACEALGITRRRLRTEEDHLRQGLRKALARSGISRPRPAPWMRLEASR